MLFSEILFMDWQPSLYTSSPILVKGRTKELSIIENGQKPHCSHFSSSMKHFLGGSNSSARYSYWLREKVTRQRTLVRNVSVLHQDEGGIGKSIPDEGDGFPNTSRVLVRTISQHQFFYREWIRKSFPGNDERMSVLHQDEGGIGKSIPDAQEIS